MSYELILGDCLEIMKSFPDNHFSAVVTDPPYGINFINGGGRSAKAGWRDFRDNGDWDKYRPSREVFDEIFRIGEKVVIWGGNYFTDYLPPSRGWLAWHKPDSAPSMASIELAWTNQDANARMISHTIAATNAERIGHPTQKPLRVMKWCLDVLKVPVGATVFDPFMGSGTTGVACIKMGRNFIGCEINPAYLAIATKRIQDAAAQPMLLEVT